MFFMVHKTTRPCSFVKWLVCGLNPSRMEREFIGTDKWLAPLLNLLHLLLIYYILLLLLLFIIVIIDYYYYLSLFYYLLHY